MARRKTNFTTSLQRNSVTYQHYYERLKELAISMFEWKNMPPTVDIRFLELALFNNGSAVFFRDEVMGELCLEVALGGRLDVYRIPTNRRAYSCNGYQKQLTESDSVIIYNNLIHTNSVPDIEMFAQRMYNLDRIIDVNANAQKTPVLIKTSESQRLTMQNLYMQYDGNQPFIFGDKDLDVKGLTVLKTDAPYIGDQMYQLKTQYWNEAMTYLGISNVSFQKKERMLQDEVTRTQGGVVASRYSRLESRRMAVRQINAMFGLNLEVNYREDYQVLDDDGVNSDEGGDGIE